MASENRSSRRRVASSVLRVAVINGMVISGAALLAGCSGGAIGEHLPKAVGGLPEGVPQRPAIPADYPAVHDTAPPRTEAVLTDEQQIKLEQELIAARDRAAASRAAGGAANQ